MSQDPHLSPRESDVLVFISKGLSYSEVAAVLGLRLSTVQGYIKSLYEKLDIDSKAEAAVIAAQRGLV